MNNNIVLTDSHCHLADIYFIDKLDQICKQMVKCQVQGLIVVTAQAMEWNRALVLENYPYIRAVALGVHPWFVEESKETDLFDLERLLQQNSNLWIGEIGLDFYGDRAHSQEKQITILRAQLKLAQQYARPVVIHNVKATHQLMALMQEIQFSQVGIMHAFSGSLEEAMWFTKRGFKIGIGALVLNKNAKKIRRIATELPLQWLVLETDSPFMRIGSNSPADVFYIAQEVALLRGIQITELSEQVEINLKDLLIHD